MLYFQQLFYRAWSDTWEMVVESPVRTVVIAVCIFSLSAFLTYRWKGWSEMKDLLFGSGVVVLSTIIIFVTAFVVNLLVLSPKALIEESQLNYSKENAARMAAERNQKDTADDLKASEDRAIRLSDALNMSKDSVKGGEKIKELESLLAQQKLATAEIVLQQQQQIDLLKKATTPLPFTDRLKSFLSGISISSTVLTAPEVVQVQARELNSHQLDTLQALCSENEAHRYIAFRGSSTLFGTGGQTFTVFFDLARSQLDPSIPLYLPGAGEELIHHNLSRLRQLQISKLLRLNQLQQRVPKKKLVLTIIKSVL